MGQSRRDTCIGQAFTSYTQASSYVSHSSKAPFKWPRLADSHESLSLCTQLGILKYRYPI